MNTKIQRHIMAAGAVIFRSIHSGNTVQCFTKAAGSGFDKIFMAQYGARSGMFENIIFLGIGQPVPHYRKGVRAGDYW